MALELSADEPGWRQDCFAPDAHTSEARTAASRPTMPAPPPRPEDATAEQAEKRRFGSLARVPRLAVRLDVLTQMKLDAASGFLLSHVDGATSVEDLLDVCAMPHVQALRLLGALRFLGIIELEEPRRRTG